MHSFMVFAQLLRKFSTNHCMCISVQGTKSDLESSYGHKADQNLGWRSLLHSGRLGKVLRMDWFTAPSSTTHRLRPFRCSRFPTFKGECPVETSGITGDHSITSSCIFKVTPKRQCKNPNLGCPLQTGILSAKE